MRDRMFVALLTIGLFGCSTDYNTPLSNAPEPDAQLTACNGLITQAEEDWDAPLRHHTYYDVEYDVELDTVISTVGGAPDTSVTRYDIKTDVKYDVMEWATDHYGTLRIRTRAAVIDLSTIPPYWTTPLAASECEIVEVYSTLINSDRRFPKYDDPMASLGDSVMIYGPDWLKTAF